MIDPKELQAARKSAAERYEAIAALYVPHGWRVVYRNDLSGRCYFKREIIAAPKPRTRKSLYVFLHECAHANLHGDSNKPRHVEEYEAEKWAHDKMKEHGVPVPRTMTKRAREYVAKKIWQAENAGAKRIDPAARRFAKGVF
jgi:hypothetical protein